MNMSEIWPNLSAMFFSFIAIIMLFMFAWRMRGGAMSVVINYLVTGIFFAVFVHAGFELVEAYGWMSFDVLRYVMGILLTLGGLCFVMAGYLGLKLMSVKSDE
ncbi:MAG: hypothetical protein AABY34_02505 [Pseudomonadota bacterium]